MSKKIENIRISSCNRAPQNFRDYVSHRIRISDFSGGLIIFQDSFEKNIKDENLVKIIGERGISLLREIFGSASILEAWIYADGIRIDVTGWPTQDLIALDVYVIQAFKKCFGEVEVKMRETRDSK